MLLFVHFQFSQQICNSTAWMHKMNTRTPPQILTHKMRWNIFLDNNFQAQFIIQIKNRIFVVSFCRFGRKKNNISIGWMCRFFRCCSIRVFRSERKGGGERSSMCSLFGISNSNTVRLAHCNIKSIEHFSFSYTVKFSGHLKRSNYIQHSISKCAVLGTDRFCDSSVCCVWVLQIFSFFAYKSLLMQSVIAARGNYFRCFLFAFFFWLLHIWLCRRARVCDFYVCLFQIHGIKICARGKQTFLIRLRLNRSRRRSSNGTFI